MASKWKFQPRGKLLSKGHTIFVPWVTCLWTWHANMMSQVEVKQMEKPDPKELSGGSQKEPVALKIWYIWDPVMHYLL